MRRDRLDNTQMKAKARKSKRYSLRPIAELHRAVQDGPERRSRVQKDLYASYLKRVLSVVLDGMIWVSCTILILVGTVLGLNSWISQGTPQYEEFVYTLVLPLFPIISLWLYLTIMESSKVQATIGKLATRIIVTALNYNRIGFGRANARFWSKVISIPILPSVLIVPLFTKKRQALHDLISGTLVINKRR